MKLFKILSIWISFWITVRLIPIVALISAIIDSHKKEYTEMFYHSTSKDNKNDEWFRY